jgi:opacity protein-like surface antigen/outer membrane protease
MKKLLIAGVSLAALMTAGPVGAADMAVKAPPPAPPPVWNWTGGYVGLHSGLGVGTATFANPYGDIGGTLFGNDVSTPAYLFGAQIGYNYQMGPIVAGIEADASWMTSDGTNTCFAVSGLFLSSTCRVQPDFMGTLTGRLGYAAGPEGKTLFYGKGGLAVMHEDIDIVRNNNAFFAPVGVDVGTSATRAGWTAGVGVEQAIAPAWSWKFEYDYQRFSSADATTPTTANIISFFPIPLGFVVTVPPRTTSVVQDFHTFKIGLNYKWGADPWATFPVGGPAPAFPTKAPPIVAAWAPGWEFEGGARYWYAFGRYQKNIGLFTTDPSPTDTNVSRLTYDNMRTRNGELFGRIDSPYKVFVKGFVGGGDVVSGKMNDEDWLLFFNPAVAPGFGQYSLTNSSPVDGDTRYATVDLGYTWLRGPTYKSGVFVGYNYFREKMNAFGCVEVGGPLTCIPSIPNTGSPIITEDDTWRSLRIGSGGEISLGPVRLSAEAAYLPYVRFRGEDNHFFGNTGTLAEVFAETGRGRGVQFEAMATYDVTEYFSVGMGGRYWAMWTRTGEVNCTFGAGGLCGVTPTPLQNFKAATEQAGLLIQGSFKFGVPSAAVPVAGRY